MIRAGVAVVDITPAPGLLQAPRVMEDRETASDED